MCRLYGFLSNTPRKVECELIRAQNALIVQSRRDEHGENHPHGWGLGAYERGIPFVQRRARAAFRGNAFRWAVARVFSPAVMAHVRRATVGGPKLENTHPFEHGPWLFAHNGTLDAFSEIRPRMLEAMTPSHRRAVRGDTDSEHVFHLLLSLRERTPEAPLLTVLHRGLQHIIDWSLQMDPDAETTLNTLWTNGEELVGSRLGRSLWMVRRDAVHPCEVCGGILHVDEDHSDAYRAVVVASERITTDERWREVPENSLFHIDRHVGWHLEAL